jgi:hypothetical protein
MATVRTAIRELVGTVLFVAAVWGQALAGRRAPAAPRRPAAAPHPAA